MKLFKWLKQKIKPNFDFQDPDFIKWSFGKDDAEFRFNDVPRLWNSLHPELPVSITDDVRHSKEMMKNAYLKYK